MCKISIIMPVYNVAAHLSRSINSVLQQTLRDVELICVDDASTDNSLQLLKEYADTDSRVKVLQQPDNRSALQARKLGALYAKGDYLMFLDADDWLDPNACNYLYPLISKKNVDILHFDSVIDNYGTSQKRIDNMTHFVQPYYKALSGTKVFEGCFCDNLYKFNLWNKIYRTSLVQTAFVEIPEGYYPKANDLAAYFILAFHAKTYLGVHSPALYHYCFGNGSTGATCLSLKSFRTYCHEALITSMLETFLMQNEALAKYSVALKQIQSRLLQECLHNWMEYLPEESSPQGLDLLAEYWGVDTVIDAIIRKYHRRKMELIPKMNGAAILCHTCTTVHTLGIFYHRMAKGGVQRVISLLIPMYLEMGYQVVLFTDESEPDQEYFIPPTVIRVLLPSSLDLLDEEYYKRSQIFRQELLNHHIDIMLYHAASNEKLFFDALVVKALGIPFVVTVHELFSQNMANRSLLNCQKVQTYKIIDCLVVLSHIEQMYWNALGINAVYVSNPVEQIQISPAKGRDILWLGRLEQTQKQYMHAVEIMSYIVKKLPDAKLKIVGNEVTPGAVKQLEKRISTLHLENNVEICGFTDDVSQYYKHARVFLVTSSYESFPMTIIESKLWHVPLVTYDMPYLELLKDHQGYIAVPQDAFQKAADAVISLFQNDLLYHRLSEEAGQSIKQFAHIDLKAAWKDIFDAVLTRKNLCVENNHMKSEDVGIIIQTMLLHYSKGLSYQSQYKTQVGGASTRVIENDSLIGTGFKKLYNLFLYSKENGKKAALSIIKRKLKGLIMRRKEYE